MDHFEFAYYSRDGEVTRFEQDIADEEGEYNICTIQRLCKRFAIAMGYSPTTVNKAFGEDLFEEEWDV